MQIELKGRCTHVSVVSYAKENKSDRLGGKVSVLVALLR